MGAYIHGECIRKKGMSKEYKTWSDIKQRCFNKNRKDYSYYGGRGITICKRWLSFSKFLKDMGRAPSKKHTVDRKNVNKDYKPSNCKWATRHEQANNQRSNKIITFNGKSMNTKQWCVLLGLKYNTIQSRLRLGWSVNGALTGIKSERL